MSRGRYLVLEGGDGTGKTRQAALLVEDEGQDMKLSLALEDLTDDWSRELIAREDFDGVDGMYERITLAMPERAEGVMKPGRDQSQPGLV